MPGLLGWPEYSHNLNPGAASRNPPLLGPVPGSPDGSDYELAVYRWDGRIQLCDGGKL